MEHIKSREGRFTGQKNHSLYYQYWLPSEDIKAILLLSHGIGDHSGYWINVINHFIPEGYAICGHDHRGHGQSEGIAGYVKKFQYYIDDLRSFTEKVQADFPDKKTFLIGISMGGLIATAYSLDHQKNLTGLILAGPLLDPESVCSPLLMPVARVFSLVLPKLRVEGVDFSMLSHDPLAIDRAINDPFVYNGKNTMRLGAELLKATKSLPRRIQNITLPIMIMHGTADKICNPDGSKMLFELISSKDKTLKLYQDFYHEIFNEVQHDQVLADMQVWLSAHT